MVKKILRFALIALSVILFGQICFAQSINSVEISPALDISRFAPYKILADISGSPTSVSIDVTGINGDLPDPMRWDYYVDGTSAAGGVTQSMTYNSGSGKWESDNIYPDSIYPEVYFADSNTTWYNSPSDKILQKNSYQLMHFTNPFTMVGDMSFFIEFNAVPRSSNSQDLEVYLVKKGKNASFFNSDWRSSADVELVGIKTNQDSFHHTHTANSSHHLVPLLTNSNGTVGVKNLDISDDFWIVLYSKAPINNLGWNLKYHPACDDRGMWYQGSQAGWTTTAQSGCPDAHIHVARRDTYIDGVKSVVTANFAGEDPVISTDYFYFSDLPNLPPNSTSFITPIPGGIYNGGGTDEIEISWAAATDPNNDSLLYSIYLLNSSDEVIATLATGIASTSYTWDISGVDNGTYGLKGTITENILTDPLSTDFYLDGYFTINKELTIYALNTVSISSNNADPAFAEAGDVITLNFTATGALNAPTVNLYSGGDTVNNAVTVSNISGNTWQATYTVSDLDTRGYIGFTISSSNLDLIYLETTDDSYVYFGPEEDSIIPEFKGLTYVLTAIFSLGLIMIIARKFSAKSRKK